MTTAITARTDLTDAEQRVLALIGAHGEAGLASLGRDCHPLLATGNSREAEALTSLARFGLVSSDQWQQGRGWPYRLTEAGRAVYAEQRTAVSRYSGCPACVLLPCVCSYRLACMGAAAPELGIAQVHASLGCHGTHD